ncbi:head-tail connector protein [Lactiplantibacillus plantarum]|nr:head-tail connector protein [Lactiplantibacillus plantarum]MBU7446232.1 head-tail connector protein [Lactiplantibacillus plantarum]MBU7459367.1 head-tail connector protein [Lactiplantibacillus plantarum]
MSIPSPIKIVPALQNCSITEPAKSADGRYYLDPSHMTVTLKADTGYIFESDGSLSYQPEFLDDMTSIPIKATKTDTATVSLPSDISWDEQFSFPLKMTAVKPTTTPVTTPTQPTTPVTTPTQPTKPATVTTPTQPTKPATVTTQLDTLKNSLRIPSDLKDDDKLLQSYIDGATEYLRSTIDSDEDVVSKLNSKRAQVVINALAELMYENRGSDKVAKGFPYTLQVLINQLRFA